MAGLRSTEVSFVVCSQHQVPAVGLEVRGHSWNGGQEGAEAPLQPLRESLGDRGTVSHTLGQIYTDGQGSSSSLS